MTATHTSLEMRDAIVQVRRANELLERLEIPAPRPDLRLVEKGGDDRG